MTAFKSICISVSLRIFFLILVFERKKKLFFFIVLNDFRDVVDTRAYESVEILMATTDLTTEKKKI